MCLGREALFTNNLTICDSDDSLAMFFLIFAELLANHQRPSLSFNICWISPSV